MKIFLAILFTLSILSCDNEINSNDKILLSAFDNKQSDLQVTGKGTVIVLLADDTTGSQHQKFILELDSKQTLLISLNIDLTPKITTLKIGDLISFYGEYEYNDKGGVVHWTHIDPAGKHINGWLIHGGLTYE
ncbi:MAG: DUF3465 domain-containing protein [Saccharospirillaceae bacterium]|nr:DUF3465 domain-containing protein [Pseudomonadales bacterium]NRB79252.1 DUF3465 domain-containing protein [Saccharospirillaceae bacterium]